MAPSVRPPVGKGQGKTNEYAWELELNEWPPQVDWRGQLHCSNQNLGEERFYGFADCAHISTPLNLRLDNGHDSAHFFH